MDCWINILTKGRVAETLPWAQEMLDTAKATGDADLLISGHRCSVQLLFLDGQTRRVDGTRRQGAGALRRSKDIAIGWACTNLDPKTVVCGIASLVTWMLGYPDRAVRMMRKQTRTLAELVTRSTSAMHLSGGGLFDCAASPRRFVSAPKKASSLGRDNSMPLLWAVMAPLRYGMALIREGNEC